MILEESQCLVYYSESEPYEVQSLFTWGYKWYA